MNALAILTRPRGRRERREAAGEREADDYITGIHAAIPTVTDADYHAGFRSYSERMADTDIRRTYELPARLPRTLPPLPVARDYTPRVAALIPEACHCGKGWRGHIPDWVTEILHHPTTAETVEADSMLMGALTPDVLAKLDQAAVTR